MPFREGSQSDQILERETLGHQIEDKVEKFLLGSFDFIESIERTRHNGVNDKKGVDLVIQFEGSGRMAIDVTANVGAKVDEKVKSMMRNPLVGIVEKGMIMGK